MKILAVHDSLVVFWFVPSVNKVEGSILSVTHFPVAHTINCRVPYSLCTLGIGFVELVRFVSCTHGFLLHL